MNHYQRGKGHGAVITDDRNALEHFLTIARDRTAETNERHFARGVIMGAGQRLDKSANHFTAAIKALGLDKPGDAELATPAPLSGDELVLALSRAVDAVRENAGTPVWTPLEAVLPYEWCGAFMFMGAQEYLTVGSNGFERRTVFLYKHGITRRYLNIGEDLNAYTYRPNMGDIDEPVYQRMRMETAIATVFERIEQYGADRTTKYDAAFIADRNARLVAAGYTVVG
jgi:hypothetical protein